MILLRILAWVLIIAGFLVLCDEVYLWAARGFYHAHALGELWYQVHPASLNLMQAGIERHVSPWLWENVVQPVLLMPAVLVFGVPGVALRLVLVLGPATQTETRKR